MIKKVIGTFMLSCGSRCDTDSAASTVFIRLTALGAY